VTDRRLAEDRIRHLANFDTLTGLPNRRQLIWRAERALDHGRRLGHEVALLLIDLDRFKIINDTLGHGAGDELLMEVSRRLRSCVRHSDQVLESSLESVGVRSHRTLEAVGRLGGDEFVALLPEVVDEADAERVASRILEQMRKPIMIGLQECFVTASVGIAIFPRDGATVADLLRNSDIAMYSVKSAGRNSSSLYRPNLAGKGREKLELESALHKAIERNELVLHYQPKIDVRGARMIGAEALMRWRRHGTLVAPGDFIPLAEETGLIIPLSEWAIREAARQARIWQDNFGFSDSIAVNLPSRLFERTDLVEYIHNAVTTYGVPHHAIELEITETGLMKDLQNVIPSLHRLNEIGVEISIDDFGTGYSSLAYLTTLPISELKIDRSFVRDLGMTPQSSAVVTAIIALARSLGLRVIAEGVENLRQMEVLHRLGCGIMQGFSSASRSRRKTSSAGCSRPCCRRRRPGSARRRPATRPSRRAPRAGASRAPSRRQADLKRAVGPDRRHEPDAPRAPRQDRTADGADRQGGAASSRPRAARADARELRARVPPGSGRAARRGDRGARHPDRADHSRHRAKRPQLDAGTAQGRHPACPRRRSQRREEAAAAALAARQQLGNRFGGDARGGRRGRCRGRADAPRPARRRRACRQRADRRSGAGALRRERRVVRRVGAHRAHARTCLEAALPAHDGANQELAKELARVVERIDAKAAAEPLADDVEALARRVERVLQHRHHLFDQLGKLCHELTASLTDLAEDGSWVKGQCEAMQLKIEEGLSARGVRAVSDMLHHARKRHAEVRGEREKARDALKSLMAQMLAELGELGSKTGNFHESVGRYAAVIEESDSLESLTGVVREMVAESRAVQSLVQQTQERLQEEHSKATDLSERVTQLEDEMRRLSDEVSTDQLTQIANRRGLMQAFEVERARLERSGGELSIGLLDIDNFKKLNDELGHSAGDEALKSLAAVVSKTLRPTDRVARYGGEEFVVLLPRRRRPRASRC
jgi:predicted signal transduction protein with EAL and GGDEF domain